MDKTATTPDQTVLTTKPLPASRKILVKSARPDIRVAMREIQLAPTRSTGGAVEENPPFIVYDTSGPYTDPNAAIDIRNGLLPLRRKWILDRGDVEELPHVSSEYG